MRYVEHEFLLYADVPSNAAPGNTNCEFVKDGNLASGGALSAAAGSGGGSSSHMGSAGNGGGLSSLVRTPRALVWTVKKFPGNTEMTLVCRVSLDKSINLSKILSRVKAEGNSDAEGQILQQMLKSQFGPIALTFEIPMYNVSKLQVRYLRISEKQGSNYNPYRWVRYVTQSSSYVCRT